MDKIETLYHKQVTEFEKLFKQLGLHLGYKKARERDKLVKLNRKHFLELLKEVEEKVDSMMTLKIPNVPQGHPKMIGHNRALEDLTDYLTSQREIIEKGNI